MTETLKGKNSKKLALALIFMCLAPLTLSANWSQYRGSEGNGISNNSIKNTNWSESKPKIDWKINANTGFSSFAIADGKAITLVKRDNQETCIALDAKTGNELWQAKLGKAKYDGGGGAGTRDNSGGDGPRSTPAINDGHVYIYDANLTLHCLNLANGKHVWKKNIKDNFGGQKLTWQNASSPIIEGELVFVAGGGSGQSFLAFNKKSGNVAWKAFDEKLTHTTPVAATIHDKRQIIFFAQSGLVSVEPVTGKELWRYNFPYKVSTAASPVVHGDFVFCSAGYGVGAGLCQVSKNGDNFSAKQLWRKPNKLINHWSTPVVKDGHLYGMFSFKKYGKGPLQCIDMRTGEIKWSKAGYGPGNVILAGDQLIALADNGEIALVAANPDSYKENGRIKAVNGKCWSTPAISDGKIYIRSTTQAACLDVSK